MSIPHHGYSCPSAHTQQATSHCLYSRVFQGGREDFSVRSETEAVREIRKEWGRCPQVSWLVLSPSKQRDQRWKPRELLKTGYLGVWTQASCSGARVTKFHPISTPPPICPESDLCLSTRGLGITQAEPPGKVWLPPGR